MSCAMLHFNFSPLMVKTVETNIFQTAVHLSSTCLPGKRCRATSDIPRKRGTAHGRDALQSPVIKSGGTQSVIFTKVYTSFASLLSLRLILNRCYLATAGHLSWKRLIDFGHCPRHDCACTFFHSFFTSPLQLELFCSVNVLQFIFLALQLDKFIVWSWVVSMCLLFIRISLDQFCKFVVCCTKHC